MGVGRSSALQAFYSLPKREWLHSLIDRPGGKEGRWPPAHEPNLPIWPVPYQQHFFWALAIQCKLSVFVSASVYSINLKFIFQRFFFGEDVNTVVHEDHFIMQWYPCCDLHLLTVPGKPIYLILVLFLKSILLLDNTTIDESNKITKL